MKRELLRDVWIRRNEKSLKSVNDIEDFTSYEDMSDDELVIETDEDKEEKKDYLKINRKLDDYIIKNNIPELVTTYDDDVIRNDDIISSFDGEKSSNPIKSFKDYISNSESLRIEDKSKEKEFIKLMTEKFIENGGEIEVIPTTFKSGLNPSGYYYKTSNSESKPLDWSEESEYEKFNRIPQRLCPYNIYWKYLEGSKEEPQTRNDETPYIPLNA